MNKIYNSLRLLGYKIKEFPTGYFITKNNSERYSLFDSQGNVILSNKERIEFVSEFLYLASDKKSDLISILYDKYGNIIDKADSYNIHIQDKFVKVIHRDELGRKTYNIYGIQGDSKFIGIQGNPFTIVNDQSKSRLIYSDSKGNMQVLDTDGNNLQLHINRSEFVEANKHYVKYFSEDLKYSYIIDYETNIIYKGKDVEIDKSKAEGSNLIVVDKRNISIVSRDGNSIKTVQKIEDNRDSFIFKVHQTSEPNIVCIHTFGGNYYLLNMLNGKMSEQYQHIDIDEFIGDNIEHDGKVSLIDRETLEETTILADIMIIGQSRNIISITRRDSTGKEISERYTKDFRKLISEFN